MSVYYTDCLAHTDNVESDMVFSCNSLYCMMNRLIIPIVSEKSIYTGDYASKRFHKAVRMSMVEN